jgi:TPR repeat protein
MKLTGKGTSKNVSSAKQWLSLASQKGDKVATRMLNEYSALFKQVQN